MSKTTIFVAIFPCSVYFDPGQRLPVYPSISSPLARIPHHIIKKRGGGDAGWKIITIFAVACLVVILIVLLLFMAIAVSRKRSLKNIFPPDKLNACILVPDGHFQLSSQEQALSAAKQQLKTFPHQYTDLKQGRLHHYVIPENKMEDECFCIVSQSSQDSVKLSYSNESLDSMDDDTN